MIYLLVSLNVLGGVIMFLFWDIMKSGPFLPALRSELTGTGTLMWNPYFLVEIDEGTLPMASKEH